MAVYLDAPYTRDEYSRYYHVLETLVRYGYPASIGRGRVPVKGEDRFSSDLFTRDASRMAERLAQIICAILRRGWLCAWSYADSGLAPIALVIDKVEQSMGGTCSIHSYSVPYNHHSQGRRPHKRVTEYLLLFTPRAVSQSRD